MSRPTSPALAAVVALAALALGGCRDDDLATHDALGSYALVLPAEARAAGHYDSLFVTLEMTEVEGSFPRPGSRHVRTRPARRAGTPTTSPPDSLVVDESRFYFQVKGDELLIFYECRSLDGAIPNCAAGPHLRGPLDGDRLTLHSGSQMSYPSRHYRRVAR